MNNKKLLLIFSILAIVFIVTKLSNKKIERSFDSDLFQFESEHIDEIRITSKEGATLPYTLVRIEDAWEVKDETISALAVPEKVASFLETIDNIQALRIAAKSPEKWEEYELEEEKAKKIQLFSNGKLKEELVIGRFDFNQQTRSAKSYVRQANDNNVYVVDGLLAMTLGQDRDAFRNTRLVKIDPAQVQSIKFSTNDNLVNISKENFWINSNNEIVDSTLINQYLQRISNLQGAHFAQKVLQENSKIATLHLQFEDTKDIEISAWKYKSGNEAFIIGSSDNENEVFYSDSLGHYKTLFADEIFAN